MNEKNEAKKTETKEQIIKNQYPEVNIIDVIVGIIFGFLIIFLLKVILKL